MAQIQLSKFVHLESCSRKTTSEEKQDPHCCLEILNSVIVQKSNHALTQAGNNHLSLFGLIRFKWKKFQEAYFLLHGQISKAQMS